MKLRNKTWAHSLLALACALSVSLTPNVAHASAKPQPLKLGQTAKVTLDSKTSKDYTVSLPKGSYRVVWDAQRVDGKISNLIGTMSLLKPNGVVITSRFINFNEIAVDYRVGTILNVPKPFVARFRITNDDEYNNWFTVVPVSPGKRVPFGWGAAITPARISSDNGVGGTLEPRATAYHSVTLPKGKWSISLGFQLPDGESSNLIGSVDLLDTLGFAKKQGFVRLNEIGNQFRTEGIITVTKPTPYLLRVSNETGDKTYTYDVTIEPAS